MNQNKQEKPQRTSSKTAMILEWLTKLEQKVALLELRMDYQLKFEKSSPLASSDASKVLSMESARKGFKRDDKAQDIKFELSAAEDPFRPIVEGLVKDEMTGQVKAVKYQLVQTFPKIKVEGKLMTLKTKARLPSRIPRLVPNHHETASKSPCKTNFYQPRYAASKIPRMVPSRSRPFSSAKHLTSDSNKSIIKLQAVSPARLPEDSFLKQIRPKLTRTSTPYDEYKSPIDRIQKEIAANKRRLQRMNAGHFTDSSEQLFDDFEFGLKRPI